MLRQPGSSMQKLALIYTSNERGKREPSLVFVLLRVCESVHLCLHEQIHACVCVRACRQRADYNNKEVEVGSDVAAFYSSTAWIREELPVN